MAFVIHANLDAEARWAGRALPGAIAARTSYYAALLAALAPEDTDVEIWAPAAIDVERLVSDPIWNTPAMRVGTPPRADLVWASPDAKAANDKRLALRVATELGFALPGTRVVASLEELDEAIAPLIESGGDGAVLRWVAKAPWSTAGRDRLLGRAALAPDQRTRASRLLEQFGELIVEPWCERIFDVGNACTIDSAGNYVGSSSHQLINDRFGTFSAILLDHGIELSAEDALALGKASIAVAKQLIHLCYRGPFSIDSFAYRDTTGQQRLRPLCEINARYTFGAVARAFGRRGARALYLADPPPGARPLIAPVDGVGAWIA